jgi:hypothetical protein
MATQKEIRAEATQQIVDLIIVAGTRIRGAATVEQAAQAFLELEDSLVLPLGMIHDQSVLRLLTHFRSLVQPTLPGLEPEFNQTSGKLVDVLDSDDALEPNLGQPQELPA